MRRPVVFLVALLLLTGGSAAMALSTTDTYASELWNIDKVAAPQAWGVSTGAVRVGIVDTGVDAGHPDLAGRVVDSVACINTNGTAAQCSGSADDGQGHGTHVAGIIAADKDNGQGVAGVAPSAQLVVARVFEGDSASVDDILAGARWVVAHGAKVVNFSLGDAGIFGLGLFVSNADVKNIANDVWTNGAIPVVAAGNDGCAGWGNTNAVVVSATGPGDEEARYSCDPTSAQWGVGAPGGNAGDCSDHARCILSTYARSQTPSGNPPYAYLQGTSMAAPVVTGALADLLAQGLSREQAINRLLSTVDPSDCGSGCRGRVNVGRAVCGEACPAVVPTGNGGGGSGPPPLTPTTLYRPPVVRKATPKATPAVTVPPVTAAPTTEAPTTTTELPTTTTGGNESALAKPTKTSSNHDVGVLPASLAILGLLGALGATGLAAWRQRFRGGGAL